MPAITWACSIPSRACCTARACRSRCPRSTPKGSRRLTFSTWRPAKAESSTPSAVKSCDKRSWVRLKQVVSENRKTLGVTLCLLLLGACAPKPPVSPAEAPEDLIDPAPKATAKSKAAPPSSPLVKQAEALLAKGDAEGARVKFEQAVAADASDVRA